MTQSNLHGWWRHTWRHLYLFMVLLNSPPKCITWFICHNKYYGELTNNTCLLLFSINFSLFVVYRFGPLRHQWCMRYESKNAQMKRFVVARSYKNVPLSVAIHHQLWMCHQLATRPGQTYSNYLYGGDTVASGKRSYSYIPFTICK